MNPHAVRHDDDPQCGWYRMQRVKGGIWVPGIIWADFDTDEAGELAGPVQIRAQTASGEELDPAEIWLWVTPIGIAEYKRISQWREDYSHRITDRSAVDLSTTPTRP